MNNLAIKWSNLGEAVKTKRIKIGISAYFNRIDIGRIIKIYMIVFYAVLLVYHSVNLPQPLGEWDDYTMPIASILNDRNISISDMDVLKYEEIFPFWARYTDNISFSGYMTRDGRGELTWYFPLYSILCLPCTLLLKFMDIPTVYTFPYTNLTLLITALFCVYRFLNVEKTRKFLLILTLSINPIVFYVGWPSGEVFIYSMLIMALVFWYNSMYRRAAVFLSLAGMMNPTVMTIGFIMITEYFWKLLSINSESKPDACHKDNIKNIIKDVIKYGCCYIIVLVPMLYNLYHTGFLNLTASLDQYTVGKESIASRFVSYLFDLNYGILPYFILPFLMSWILLILSMISKKVRYIEWMIAFLLTVLTYSMMVHINSGMAGISRYNSWGVLPMIFAVVLFCDTIIKKKRIIRAVKYAVLAGTILTGVIVFSYGPVCASKTSCHEFTPIAAWVMNRCPSIYNPLPSTFCSRVKHEDGGYNHETPVAYHDKDGIVRKILVKKDDREYVIANFKSNYGKDKWLASQFDEIGNGEHYITCPAEYGIYKVSELLPEYAPGSVISFASGTLNSNDYTVKGLSTAEEWGTWTDGREYVMRFRTTIEGAYIHATVCANVYNQKQRVSIYVNGKEVLTATDFTGGKLEFDFENPGANHPIWIRFELPDAISPIVFGSADDRLLGLGLISMVFSEK